MSPHVRTVKTSSGATAVQIVYSNRRGSRTMEHLGSAHTEAEVELLKAAARQKLAAGQGELDLELPRLGPEQGGPLPIRSSRMRHLWESLEHAYQVLHDILGYDEALEVDCMDILRAVFPNGFPAPYIKGFVVIQSKESLDVTAVHTTATLDERGNPANQSGIDVEQIKERRVPGNAGPASPRGSGTAAALER